MIRTRSVYWLSLILLAFHSCSKSSETKEEQRRTFVRIEVDNQVYEYFDANVKAEHSVSSYANTVGHLYDTAAADLQGKPGFFISYSGVVGKKDGDFWVTWGTWNKFSFSGSTSPDSWTTGTGGTTDPAKRRFTVSQISADKKNWSGDFYHEVVNSLGQSKIIKGTYSIVSQ